NRVVERGDEPQLDDHEERRKLMRRGALAAWAAAAGLAALGALAQAPHPDLESLAARIQVLEDREAIRALILAYGEAHDRRDYRTLANLFAANGEWIGGLGSARGPDANF